MGIRQDQTTKHAFRPVATKRSADLAVDAIAQAIFFCHVNIGERLPSEVTLSRQLGINRSALREALKRMEADGILEVRPGAAGGTFVTGRPPETYIQLFLPAPAEVADFVEILITRRAIEPQIVELAAARATAQDIEEMRAILAPLEGMRGKSRDVDDDIETLSRAALQFNTALGKATHIKFLETIMQVLSQQIEPVRRMATRDDPAAAIDTLFRTLSALEKNDRDLISTELERRFNYLERAWEKKTGRKLWRGSPSFLPSDAA
ncbi:FCD domain-containing protein [Acuticoccus sp. MNP-M23]|uniref:FadR/GntR family transcriptional regulator n=1 Tax=Acuticoccus sp. MNP-M23 TaxID=3072793 RepID=UPI0028160021|nr:FCD domain-containing protein [Acuticoccus sp. MNP-M23]WMS44636.1 FCD domain-containing protein [Acuticoccus sp. MNP-M23]